MKPEELKALRTRLGLTQQEMGVKLGFQPKAARLRISEMERGVATITTRTEIICGYVAKGRKGRR